MFSSSYELNLSVQQSGFTVYRKYKPSPEDEKKVKVGPNIFLSCKYFSNSEIKLRAFKSYP